MLGYYIMNTRALKLGYYAALLAFIASVGFDVVQTLQVVGGLKFPADAISIYAFSLLITRKRSSWTSICSTRLI